MANSAFGSGYGGASDLGLGDMLGAQVAGETDEERKKRLAALAAQRNGVGSPMSAIADVFGGGAKAGGMLGSF